jgi:hypothetical protein
VFRFLEPEVRVIAVCDLDAVRLAEWRDEEIDLYLVRS